jgi:hypothetical protein
MLDIFWYPHCQRFHHQPENSNRQSKIRSRLEKIIKSFLIRLFLQYGKKAIAGRKQKQQKQSGFEE